MSKAVKYVPIETITPPKCKECSGEFKLNIRGLCKKCYARMKSRARIQRHNDSSEYRIF